MKRSSSFGLRFLNGIPNDSRVWGFILAVLIALWAPVHAQQTRIARLGVLRVDAQTSPVAKEAIHDLKNGLRSLGYDEGQNIHYEIRWAENKLDALSVLAAELVKFNLDAIVTGGPQAVKSLKERTSTIPNRNGPHG
jgi:hypothetical protein